MIKVSGVMFLALAMALTAVVCWGAATTDVLRVQTVLGGQERTVELTGVEISVDTNTWQASLVSIDVADEPVAEKLRYVTRGNLGAWDFTKPDFTRDDAWHDLVLTNGQMSISAQVLHIRMNLSRSVESQIVKFRKKDGSGGVNEHRPVMDGLNNCFPEWWMDIGTNCTVEYWISSGTWTNIKFVVLGEFAP